MAISTDRYAALAREIERERAASLTFVVEGAQGTIFPVRPSQREAFVRAWRRLGYDETLGRAEKEQCWQSWRARGARR